MRASGRRGGVVWQMTTGMRNVVVVCLKDTLTQSQLLQWAANLMLIGKGMAGICFMTFHCLRKNLTVRLTHGSDKSIMGKTSLIVLYEVYSP